MMFGSAFVVLAYIASMCRAQTFEWFAESPQNCARDPSQCCATKCYGNRDVYCRVRGTTTPVSPLFCAHLRNLYATRVECAENECQRDCVVGEWTPWSACSATCGFLSTEYRSRRVLVSPEAGRECPALGETRPCQNASLRLPCPAPPTPSPPRPVFYLWRLGPWSNCQPLGGNATQCGPGSISRVVDCVASNGTRVSDINCKANARESAPIDHQACNLPCDCLVTHWSQWSNCSAQCYARGSNISDSNLPFRERTRRVIRASRFGGASCPPLLDRLFCDLAALPDCPRYRWYNGSWLACNLDQSGAACGFGFQTRAVFCIAENDTSLTPHDDRFCTGEFLPPGAIQIAAPVKPLSSRPCQIFCPEDCVVGAWSEWSSCSQSCGDGGTRRRTRPVLVAPLHGGLDCEDLSETSPCERINCTFWSVGRFSACLPHSGDCGLGERIRHVLCLNSLNQAIDSSQCPGSHPTTKDDCYLPCPDDCTLTAWSSWTGCPGTCGGAGITQKRTRSILSYNSTSGRQCVDADQLEQRKPCNLFVPCITYVWRRDRWQTCSLESNQGNLNFSGDGSGSHPNSTATPVTEPPLCGPDVGVRQRDVYCEQQFSGIGRQRVANADCFDSSNIVIGSQPTAEEQCDIDCPIDCELSTWSDWSQCSSTCGSATRLRSRFVTKAAAFGGTSCPPNRDGIITETSLCTEIPPCYSYSWNAGSWSPCILIRLDANDTTTCGPGFRTRDVTCVRSGDNLVVDDGVCSFGLLTARPSAVVACNVICDDECEFGSWTAFSTCSATCGGGSKTRTRDVLFKNSTLSPSERNHTCPHISPSDLTQTDPCNDFPCLQYDWVASEWLSCIPTEDGALCGDGIQARHVNCETSTDHVFVSAKLCDFAGDAPNRTQACHVPCPIDCRLGNWSQWSVCNGSCGSNGLGFEIRQRSILTAPQNGGRPCLDLEQKRPCVSECEWDIGLWSECRLNNKSLSCGDGLRNRSVVCRINGQIVNDGRCLALGDEPGENSNFKKPISEEACRFPCLDECVLSEWSEWSDCESDLNPEQLKVICRDFSPTPGHHTRSRFRLRGTSACSTHLDEDIDCRPRVCHSFSWHVTDWGSCIIPADADCGVGTQERQIVCASDFDPRRRDVTACDSSLIPTPTSRQCHIPCPIDCDVETWSRWQCVDGTCGGAGKRSRTRATVTVPNQSGRQCPALSQHERCAFDPCFSYTYERSPWGNCSVGLNADCGAGTRRRTVACRQSDGLLVSLDCCIVKQCSTRLDLSLVDFRALDIHEEDNCGIPCPGDCVMAPWSNWGPCVLDCASSGASRGMRSRSRGVRVAATDGGRCDEPQFETEGCDIDVNCFVYSWATSDWVNGSRNVFCQQSVRGNASSLPVTVDSGCLDELRPSALQSCVPACGESQICNMTSYKCQCDDGFVEVKDSCIPLRGCTDNSHCPLLYTVCIDGECVCDEAVGAVPVPGQAGQCVLPTTPPAPTSKVSSTVPAGNSSAEPTVDVGELGGDDDIAFWVWILVALGVLLILIAIILLIVFFRVRHSKSITFSRSSDFYDDGPMDHIPPRSAAPQARSPWLEEPRPESTISDSSIRKPPLMTSFQNPGATSEDEKDGAFSSYPATLEKDTRF